MRTAPSILLLDDGELERPKAVLASLGADFVHLERPEIENAVALPRDLLVTSLKLAQEVPAFEHPAGETLDPKWVCVADQDFRPLRERLRDLGVHYLVDARLDSESMRLFFLQLVPGLEAIAITKVDEPLASEPVEEGEAGGERRTYPRKEYKRRLWALGEENVEVVLGHDLSLTGIRVDTSSNLSVGDRVELALYGGPREEPLVVQAAAVRDDGERLGLRFENLTSGQAEELRDLCEKLPPLESLDDDTSTGVVVSRVRKSD
ncbi:MAG: PilZ domain-containing protein [Myxococcota bacterium]